MVSEVLPLAEPSRLPSGQFGSSRCDMAIALDDLPAAQAATRRYDDAAALQGVEPAGIWGSVGGPAIQCGGVGPVAPLSSLSPTEELPSDCPRLAEDKSMGRVPLLRGPAQDDNGEDVQLPALDSDCPGVVRRASRR